MSSGLIVSILAPFFNSSADGTLMMSLVNGADDGAGAGAAEVPAGAGWTEISSTSNTSVEPGPIFGGEPRSP